MSDATNRIDVHWPAGTPQDDHQRGWNLGHMAGQQEGYERGCADERRRALYEAGQGKTDWLLGREAAEFVYRNPVQSFAEAMDLCRYLHDRITGGGQ